MGIVTTAVNNVSDSIRSMVSSGMNSLRFPGAIGRESETGVSVNETQALKYTAVYSAVRIISETLASLPLKTYRRINSSSKEAARDTAIWDVMHDSPNDEMTSFQFRETMQAICLLWGDAIAEIQRNGAGDPVGLWPIHPRRVRLIRNENEELVYVVTIPENSIDDPRQERRVVIHNDDIFHLRGLSTNGLVGVTPIAMAREAIGMGVAMEEYGAQFFSNDSTPSGVLQHPEELSEGAQDRLKKNWEDAQSGLDNAHRIAILEEGMEWEQIGLPPEDTQFLESRQFQLREIARIYRVQPHLMQDLENATFSNIEEQSLEFVKYTMLPWLKRWEQQLNDDIIEPMSSLYTPTEFDDLFFEFEVDSLLRGDIETRYEAYSTARSNGWLTVNEIREKENMNPADAEGADTLFVPLNEIPLEQAASGATDQDEETDNQVEQNMAEVLSRQDKDENGQKNGENRAEMGDEMYEYRGEIRSVTGRKRLMRQYIPVIERQMEPVVGREAADIEDILDESVRRGDISHFIRGITGLYDYEEEGGLRGYIENQLGGVFDDEAKAVGEEALNEINEDFTDEIEEELGSFAGDYTQSYPEKHFDSARGQMIEIAQESNNEAELEEKVNQRLEEWEEKKAGKTADIEAHRLGNASSVTGWTLVGITTKRWVAAGSDPCPFCRLLDGQVVSMEKVFAKQGEVLQPGEHENPLEAGRDTGHPPIHAGCDCIVAPG